MPSLPTFAPMPLQRRAEPFDDPHWIFELKYDGFRALAYVVNGRCTFVSRNGHAFTSFTDLAGSIGRALGQAPNAVFDGEIVCLDANGCPQFKNLLFRRGEPAFYAFDLLYRDSCDIRAEPLAARKALLKRVLRRAPSKSRILFADHVDETGTALFERERGLDLEGIVAKFKYGPYVGERERSTWFKIRNRNYSQVIGRDELFERDRHREPVPGWHACDLACADDEATVRR